LIKQLLQLIRNDRLYLMPFHKNMRLIMLKKQQPLNNLK
jgi:hypothetical protein